MDKHQELLEYLRGIYQRLDRIEKKVEDMSRALERTPESEPLTVTFKRASEISGLSVGGLRNFVDRGHIAYVKVGSRILLDLVSLREFLRVGTPLEKPVAPPPQLRTGAKPRRGPDFSVFETLKSKQRKKKT